jgi:hypothetical protein
MCVDALLGAERPGEEGGEEQEAEEGEAQPCKEGPRCQEELM